MAHSGRYLTRSSVRKPLRLPHVREGVVQPAVVLFADGLHPLHLVTNHQELDVECRPVGICLLALLKPASASPQRGLPPPIVASFLMRTEKAWARPS